MKRRTLLLGGLGGAAGLAWLTRPTDQGADHAPYFQTMSGALHGADFASPTLVIDRKIMLENIATLQSHIGDRFHYRIVVKSLPSISLLEEVMKVSGSNRLMLFHQPFINQVATQFPHTDILLGKPMPVTAARNFYREFTGGEFDPARQLRWLLDTPQRVEQYARLAQELGQNMRAALEIDIGLHRGGANSDEELAAMLDLIQASPHLEFAGFMGYEPHVVKAPGDPLKYRDYAELAKSQLGDAWPEDVVLNSAGSPTYQMYNSGDYPFNELAAGSCLVKPTDFDLPTLADHRPASWIASPVLKSLDGLEIPGINLGPLLNLWDPNTERTFYIYNGYWKAKLDSPKGLQVNNLLGRSTNQDMLNGSRSINLKADDWVFLRPTQSEFVFLQFGDIAVFDEGKIVDRWPVFNAMA
jgi:D-serine deaminase-like pyridoxal phosphate-dependent protein